MKKHYLKNYGVSRLRAYSQAAAVGMANVRVAETPYYMHLSTYGLPTSLWLPKLVDEFRYGTVFSDNQAKDYDLYNLRWIVAPPKKFRRTSAVYGRNADVEIYSIETGYFTTGVRPATIR